MHSNVRLPRSASLHGMGPASCTELRTRGHHAPNAAPESSRPGYVTRASLSESAPAAAAAAAATRRSLLLSVAAALVAGPPSLPAFASDQQLLVSDEIRQRALEAYSQRDFATAVAALNELVSLEPKDPRWREMRGMALVDGKNFTDALSDFDAALRLLGSGPASIDRARVLSGRGLAYEGISDWVSALDDYTVALKEAAATGRQGDVYVLNSVGNCHAALGEWSAAREAYLASARGFQTARRDFDGASSSQQRRLDGAVFAFSNAALMLAQLGDDAGALREFQTMARRAPGSADMRAALAALYWSSGDELKAEGEWEFACSNITVGCSKYKDEEWVRTVRRWPPVMLARLKAFLALRSGAGEKA